ncbi:dihydroneopterin aldolase [bacterium]|nr:dihydroneopterin aldolase [bacterium]
MDLLFIKDLTVTTKIGIYNWEQAIRQRLSIDLEIPLNIKNCDDRIENTLDYEKLCSLITEYVESNSFALIETVAESIAGLIKTNFNVENITVSVSKPHAVLNAGNIQIKIQR